jgi:hypothetical protein
VKETGSNTAAIIGGVAGGVVFLAIVAGCWYKHKHNRDDTEKPADKPVVPQALKPKAWNLQH